MIFYKKETEKIDYQAFTVFYVLVENSFACSSVGNLKVKETQVLVPKCFTHCFAACPLSSLLRTGCFLAGPI